MTIPLLRKGGTFHLPISVAGKLPFQSPFYASARYARYSPNVNQFHPSTFQQAFEPRFRPFLATHCHHSLVQDRGWKVCFTDTLWNNHLANQDPRIWRHCFGKVSEDLNAYCVGVVVHDHAHEVRFCPY
jgi:hypothetical protein